MVVSSGLMVVVLAVVGAAVVVAFPVDTKPAREKQMHWNPDY